MRKKTFYLNGHLKSGMFLMLNVLGGDYKSGAARGDCERSFYPSAILQVWLTPVANNIHLLIEHSTRDYWILWLLSTLTKPCLLHRVICHYSVYLIDTVT